MERPCYKCGASVEEQLPFCPACGAPQIRVSAPQNSSVSSLDAPATPPFTPGTPAAINPPAIPIHFAAPARIQWHPLFRIVLPFALLNSAATAFFPPAGFVLLLVTTVLIINRYRRVHPGPFGAWLGARVGMSTGLLSFAPLGLLFIFVILILSLGGSEVQQQMLTMLQERAAHDSRFQQIAAMISTPADLMKVLVAATLVNVLVFLLLGCIAGAVAATLQSRRE